MSKFDRKITRTFTARNLTADITINAHGGWKAVVHFTDQSIMPRDISGTEAQVCSELQRLAGGKGQFRRTIEATDGSKMAGPTVEQAKEQMIAANEGRRYERKTVVAAPVVATNVYTEEEQKNLDQAAFASFCEQHYPQFYAVQRNVDLLFRCIQDMGLPRSPLTPTNLLKAFEYLAEQDMLQPFTKKRGWCIHEYRPPAEVEKQVERTTAAQAQAERNAEIERAKAMPLEELAKEVRSGYKKLVTPGVSVAEKRQ